MPYKDSEKKKPLVIVFCDTEAEKTNLMKALSARKNDEWVYISNANPKVLLKRRDLIILKL